MIKWCLSIKLIFITIVVGLGQDKVIYVENVLADLKKEQITMDQVEIHLSEFLYLDMSLKDSIDVLVPSYFREKSINYEYYMFDSTAVDIITLCYSYKSVKDLFYKTDKNFGVYMESKFGIVDYEKDYSKIIIYKERAFVKYSDEFFSAGFIIELTASNKLSLIIAFINID